MNNHYNKELKNNALQLRLNSISKAEKFLWKQSLSRGRIGVKFKRQRPIDNFIVDFFAQEIGLVIEIDGNSHYNKGNYDDYRQKKIKSFGYTFLKFKEGDVLNNLNDVVHQIIHSIHCLKGDANKSSP